MHCITNHCKMVGLQLLMDSITCYVQETVQLHVLIWVNFTSRQHGLAGFFDRSCSICLDSFKGNNPFFLTCNYAFPTGSIYGFGKKRRKRRRKRRRRRTPTISESACNIEILHITNKAGLFHILFGRIKF